MNLRTPNKDTLLFNQSRLAAVSNYKLAELTFSPPDDSSLRKTALIKNLVAMIYDFSPLEWLTNIMRWEYFTPESLEDMTQKEVEQVIYRYSQIIYNSSLNRENYIRDQQYLFADYDQQMLVQQQKHYDEQQEMQNYYSALFSRPNAVLFSDNDNEDLVKTSKAVSHKSNSFYQPIQLNSSALCDDNKNSSRRIINSKCDVIKQETIKKEDNDLALMNKTIKNNINNNKMLAHSLISQHPNNRLSWLSDTGVATSSATAQNLATELMTLFDMEFNVNLSLPGIKRAEFNNTSTTTLNRVFSAEDDTEDSDSDEESYDLIEATIPIAKPYHTNSLQHSQDNNDIYYCATPPTPPPTLPPTPTKQRCRYYSSSDDEDSDSSEDEEYVVQKAKKIALIPSQMASFEYRMSLQGQFELSSGDESSETSFISSSFFRDSFSTTDLEAKYNNNQQQKTWSIGHSLSFKDFSQHLGKKKNSNKKNTTVKFNDSLSLKSITRKSSIQTIVNFIKRSNSSDRRGSTDSSLLYQPNNAKDLHIKSNDPPLTPRSIKRHGMYSASSLSNSSSFNWIEEAHQRFPTADEALLRNSIQARPSNINDNSKNIKEFSPASTRKMLPKSSSPAIRLLKRLTSFKKSSKT